MLGLRWLVVIFHLRNFSVSINPRKTDLSHSNYFPPKQRSCSTRVYFFDDYYSIKNCQILVKNLNFVAGMTRRFVSLMRVCWNSKSIWWVSWPKRNAASYQPRNLNSSQLLLLLSLLGAYEPNLTTIISFFFLPPKSWFTEHSTWFVMPC